MNVTAPMLIKKALDGLSLRYEATAQNIASANSRTYEPLQVRFEDALKAAAEKGTDSVEDLSFNISRAPRGKLGGEPRLDLELETASETSMRYTTLLDLLGREMQIERTAVRGEQ